ncbi:C1A family cysteine protease [Bradyrhizobium sp. AZCC 1610]|uniref:C1 family peptidase n=1 Tax=Bradyrhizobium sp. AZCC 1610 TaxID=3117020 RepID=UPI002FF1D3D3
MDLLELQKTLQEGGARWRAKQTPLLDLSPRDRKVAGIPEIDVVESLRAASGNLLPPRSSRTSAAPSVDWRTHQPPIIGAVRDQSACMSCAAFALCAAMESRLQLQEPGNGIDLSEADLFFCGGGNCSLGMPIDVALSRAQKSGVGREADFRYDPAATQCIAIRPYARVASFHYIVNDRDRRLSISEDGPVVAIMRVYTDFLAYDAGIYEQVSGVYEGLHAVVIVGYDDRERFWIARNSWGSDVGEDGYFRIRYGQCEIDTRPFIAVDPERIR